MTLTKNELKLYGQQLIETNDFPLFCETFLPDVKHPYKFYGHLKKVWEFLNERTKTLLLAPRGHGKSVTYKTAYSLFRALQNRNITIGIISNNEDTVDEMIKPIIRLAKKPKITAVFGELVNEKMTVNNQFEIKGSDKPVSVPEPTISVYSSGSGKIIGKHFDLLIIDDVVTKLNSETEHSRKKLADWIATACMPTLRKNGEVLIIGTRYHPADLYGQLIKGSFKTNYIRLKAIHNNKPLCNDLFSLEELREIEKDIGKIAFSAQFQNDATLMQEGNLVQPHTIQYYQTRDKSQKNYVDWNSDYRFVQAIDPATGKKDGDYSVCVMVAYNVKTKNIYVEDIIIERKKVSEFKILIKRQFDKYRKHYPVSYCEANGFQSVILQDMNSLFGYMRIREIKNNKNKESRFMAVLEPAFSDMGIFLNKYCKYTQQLEEQLLALTPTGSDTHDDGPDALCMAIETLPKKANIKIKAR